MSRVFTSTVEKFPGNVTLIYPVPLDEYMGWMDAVTAGQTTTKTQEQLKAYLPGICLLIEKMEIEGLPEKPEPKDFLTQTKNKLPLIDLMTWLIAKCQEVIREEENPNG